MPRPALNHRFSSAAHSHPSARAGWLREPKAQGAFRAGRASPTPSVPDASDKTEHWRRARQQPAPLSTASGPLREGRGRSWARWAGGRSNTRCYKSDFSWKEPRTQQQQRGGAPGEDPQAPRRPCAFQKLDFPSTHTAQAGSRRHQPHSPEAQKRPGNHSKRSSRPDPGSAAHPHTPTPHPHPDSAQAAGQTGPPR